MWPHILRVTMKLRRPDTTATVFRSGKVGLVQVMNVAVVMLFIQVNMVGARSEAEARLVARRYARSLSGFLWNRKYICSPRQDDPEARPGPPRPPHQGLRQGRLPQLPDRQRVRLLRARLRREAQGVRRCRARQGREGGIWIFYKPARNISWKIIFKKFRRAATSRS